MGKGFSVLMYGSIANSGLTDGSFMSVRTGDTEYKVYRNANEEGSLTLSAGNTTSYNFTYFAYNILGSVSFSFDTNDTIGFSFFANNITYSEVSTLDGIINTFQTSLGRNTY